VVVSTLVVLFSLMTYLPVFLLPSIKRHWPFYRCACYLAQHSISAGFWFLAFCLTHKYHQNQEILNAGLAQVLLGHTCRRTKGWMEGINYHIFDYSTCGSKLFWFEKVKIIFAVKELGLRAESENLTV
jgi:hypothetical protein